MYCIVCGKTGHGIHDCDNSKFFLGQGICYLGMNNQLVMSDGLALPHSDGEGGVTKVIMKKMASNAPTMLTSNVEIVTEAEYYDEPEELAVLGSMECEVLPAEAWLAEQSDKGKHTKPYDQSDPKKKKEGELTPEDMPV